MPIPKGFKHSIESRLNMNKQEQKAQTQFNHYVKEVFLKTNSGGFAFELKHSRGKDYISFSEIKEHQINALSAVTGSGLVYKLSDSSLGQKPFDSIAFKNCQAFLVCFYPKSFELIPINNFIFEMERSKRKSLTYERAKAISTISVPLHEKKA